MITHHASTGTIAYANDLTLLKRVYDHVCRERGFPSGSPEAAELAAQAMYLFQRGIFEETELLQSLRAEI